MMGIVSSAVVGQITDISRARARDSILLAAQITSL